MEQFVAKVTAIMREADQLFQTTGGSTRHYVRDLLLPMMEQAGLKIVDATPSPAQPPVNGEALAEELWDKYSYHVDDDIDSLQVVAGSSIVREIDFKKLIKELLAATPASPAKAEQEGLRWADIVAAQDEYIALLVKEIESMVGLAYVHGWRSDNHQAGALLREKISALKSTESAPKEAVPAVDEEAMAIIREAAEFAKDGKSLAKYTIWVFTDVMAIDKTDQTFRMQGEDDYRPLSELYKTYLQQTKQQ